MPKISSTNLVVSIQYRLVMDRQADRHTHDDSIYCANIALHGKNDTQLLVITSAKILYLADSPKILFIQL